MSTESVVVQGLIFSQHTQLIALLAVKHCVSAVVRQRSLRVRKTLRDLINKPKPVKQQNNLTLPLPHLPDDQHHESNPSVREEYVYDILYECQRGSWVVGYSSKTLLQFDPNPWCDADMQYTPMDTTTYQLPDPTWQWVTKEWMVDMSGDVDEAGWQYALKFHGAVWHGNYKHFRSFVRRRRWIRLRRRLVPVESEEQEEEETKDNEQKLINVDDNDSGFPQSSSSTSSSFQALDNPQHLKDELAKCRLDRERLRVLGQVVSMGGSTSEQLLRQVQEILDTLQYESSKRQFLEQLFKTRPELGMEEKRALQSLRFYTDTQAILDTF
ncbi:hypothetical protein O0I10_007008 [Lichtheimia ornata]|uniref:Peroxin/Ferlin domain-containing protein n=1 Tax=Lichtheimia ornata TaxID=688661 RepID=A0AAD7V139_9FUNG|nr:uncharacterized protein O0I10_007008 [Lichtheimia ornata]KAJ8657192.1 hypothetical protein O0I10_007008 [Lichtheimia ornata]